MSWFDAHAGAVQAVTSLAIVILTLVTIVYSRWVAREATATRRAQDNPYILLLIDSGERVRVSSHGGTIIPLEVSLNAWNGGRGPAKNVHISLLSMSAVFSEVSLPFLGAGDRTALGLRLRSVNVKSFGRDTELFAHVTYEDLFDDTWSARMELLVLEDQDEPGFAVVRAGRFTVNRPR